ncbi:glycosyltransferase [Candidatus Woesearchaeota archaeon]|nr:glycosyltransferase [Candidatus Woesearchaeota archaeon]
MDDMIMFFGSWVFALLFLFLLGVAVTFFLSFFRKQEYKEFNPKVSAVVPCYNEEKNAGKCIDAIYNSDYPEDIEVIAVDDGSDDGTLDVLKKYQKKYSKMKIIKGNHEGKSEALNKGIKKAKNEIIFTVDADTIVSKDTLKKLTGPFLDKNVGATNGSCIVRNKNNFWGLFQNIEYHYNNLIRKSFSVLFNEGIWFFGAFACYRKCVLEKAGYFKKDALTEDADIALEIYSKGYKAVNVYDSYGYVLAPSKLKDFIAQRTRWWMGVLQSLKKNRHLFSHKSSLSILFLFVNQYWWSAYSLLSLPLIIYQFYYWLPFDPGTFYEISAYTFRWFSASGPVYVLYMIPVWGLSIYNIFGVLSGMITTILLIGALFMFKEKLSLKNLIGVFFYFPYTIVLNSIIIISLIKIRFLKRQYFIK